MVYRHGGSSVKVALINVCFILPLWLMFGVCGFTLFFTHLYEGQTADSKRAKWWENHNHVLSLPLARTYCGVV